MSLIEDFERGHVREFTDYEKIQLPKKTWRTPCRRWWTPQSVLQGWRPRISDYWAWVTLHYWIVNELIAVKHVKLPTVLTRHDPTDEAWVYIDRCFGPGKPGVQAPPSGRVDLVCSSKTKPPLLVTFGAYAPVRFVLALGHMRKAHWLIAPYGCEYAFVFIIEQDDPLLERD